MPDATHTSPMALVVDEDDTARDRAGVLLGETELDVVTCASGQATVEVLRRRREDVVLLLTMARLTGTGWRRRSASSGRASGSS